MRGWLRSWVHEHIDILTKVAVGFTTVLVFFIIVMLALSC